jgi:hypothetical protein
VKKTVQMRLNENGINQPNIKIDDQPVEIVKEFKCLGSHISTTEKDVSSRIALAWVAFDKLKDISRELAHRNSRLTPSLGYTTLPASPSCYTDVM